MRNYNSKKFRTTITDWKISGDVNLFNKAINDLINRILDNKSSNVLIQITIKRPDGKQYCTNLLRKDDIIDMLTEWINKFIDYDDMDIEDVVFQVTKIEIPQGSGRKCNSIINVKDKKSIVQISNADKICLARAIVVGLSYHKEKIQEVFIGKLPSEELKSINFRRQTKTQINEGIISDIEIEYARKSDRQLQGILANTLHRICNIPIRETGNDLSDIKLFEEKLGISLNVFNMETRLIFKTEINKDITVNLLLEDNHYHVISMLPAFLGTSAKNSKLKEKQICRACGNDSKCNEVEGNPKIKCETCNKSFYSQICHTNHLDNKRCREH